MIKNAIENYYSKLDERWLKSRKTHPMTPYQDKMPKYMYKGEKNSSDYIWWLLVEKQDITDFEQIQTEEGIKFNDEVKAYFNSYYFLKMSGIFNGVRINLTPITPLVNVNVFLRERIKLARENGRNINKLEVGNAEIDGADDFLIFVDNESGEVEVLDPNKSETQIIAKSLSELIENMDPRC